MAYDGERLPTAVGVASEAALHGVATPIRRKSALIRGSFCLFRSGFYPVPKLFGAHRGSAC